MSSSVLSYDSGTADLPLVGKTVGALFDEISDKFADKTAIISVHQAIRWSFKEYREKVDALAVGLIELGLKPGDRIGIWSQNNAEWVLTQFATAKAGLILVSLNPAYRTSELEYALNKSGCKALILSPSFKTSQYIEIFMELVPELAHCEPTKLVSKTLPTLEIVIRLGDEQTPGMLNFNQVMLSGSEQSRETLITLSTSLQFDDAINIQFTSGTTGSPKGATLSHHNIVNNAIQTGSIMGITEKDIVCIPVPMYHCFGMVIGTLMSLAKGATAVLAGEYFEPELVLKTVSEERCTALYGVPTMYIAMLGHPNFSRYDLSSLEGGIMAAAPCPEEVMKQVIEKMHMKKITIAYGMTELSPVSTQTRMGDSFERSITTVGRVNPFIEGKIVDQQNNIVPRGEVGEFCSRGYSVMIGYWEDAERTAEAIDAGGWMHTGDLATMDEDGYVKIVGRSKDMVIRGGENIYPKELEEFLYCHEHIEDVQVIGVPDEKFGEELCAWVKLVDGQSMTEQQLKDFCTGKVAHYKVPRYVKFVDEFPMTVTGKIQKFVMRDIMKEELGL